MGKKDSTFKTILKCTLVVVGLGVAFVSINNGDYPAHKNNYSTTKTYDPSRELKVQSEISAYVAKQYPQITLQIMAPSPTLTWKPFTTSAPVTKDIRQKEHTFIANKNTKVYHRPTCGDINKMKESNKRTYTCTPEDMRKKGYRPCEHCNPGNW